MSVGILVVRLLYRFYVCVHLSKWFSFSRSSQSFMVVVSSYTLAGNVLRVAAVGDFGALHCQPAQKFDRSTQLQFCTSPPIEATRCYAVGFHFFLILEMVLPIDFVGLSISFIAKSIASSINDFTFGFL